MHELTQLIKSDMKPALGVTEPGAIAFAVSTAKSYLTGDVKKVLLRLNSGMYKNAFTCGIPGSSHVGNIYAAALGVGQDTVLHDLQQDVEYVGMRLFNFVEQYH